MNDIDDDNNKVSDNNEEDNGEDNDSDVNDNDDSDDGLFPEEIGFASKQGEISVRVGFPQRNGFQFQAVIYQRSSTIAPKIYS